MCFSAKGLLLFTIITGTIFFTDELSASGIAMLCSDQKFINVGDKKIDIEIEIAVFFQQIESKLIEILKSRIMTSLFV